MENTVIINSIGTATPSASKILSDALKVPQDYILKLLYSAPSVLFQKIDKKTALQAEDTLTKLGLDVTICNENDPIDLTTELVDISVSFDDVLKLPTVTEQLATFLGCKKSEVLTLMLNEPSIILGNVSKATAQALQKRVDANIHYSNPRKDSYTILVSNEAGGEVIKNISKLLKTSAYVKDDAYVIENVSYDNSQLLWRKYQSNTYVKLLNQSHQLVTITLDNFEIENEEHVSFLVTNVGMPKDILQDIQAALPIVLFENINRTKATDIVAECETIGITTSLEKEVHFKKKLQVENITDVEKVSKILGQFISKENLPKKNTTTWISNEEIPPLIARYLCAQLESLNCNPEIIH